MGEARAAAASFPVAPTPYDGARLSERMPWDERARPSAPPPAGREYTQYELAAARQLVEIHNHLRAELGQVRDLIDQVGLGLADAGIVRSAINEMTMRQNNWTLGAYCASYCRVVTTHHTLEDQSVFPHLRRGDAALAPVLARLQQEHVTIHGVLEELDAALVAFVGDADRLVEVRAATDLLADTLLSHLSYEERELLEPLARLGYY